MQLEGALKDFLLEESQENLEKVMEEGSRLVNYFARLYGGKNFQEDLVQSGFEGLLKAVKKFDHRRGVSFATYASHCIMGEIRHHLRRESKYYRPGCLTDLQSRVDRVIEERLKEGEELPTTGELAEILNVKEEGVIQVMQAGMVSLDEINWSEIKHQRHENFRLPIEDRLLLEESLDNLSSFQHKVIDLLFFQDLTQMEVAARLGISQRKVSRLKVKILKEMEKNLGELQPEY
ncbi:MAG: sigma-70 family RNA polymerase sigma factor [Candidatus Syntrophonatronum acetioxidans]|uniref:Sigma-70 family RNA polymerase sigma factor n=1 Tax=Candidatus Syntrophonatronum acetioxidans TaxID=1795816 RepID=A0A424YC57_9FIRM|nr:MAG: sigma-70 family RNA polymerase sigma factor [Candidatus Syntrophonatronum acetioxidans]